MSLIPSTASAYIRQATSELTSIAPTLPKIKRGPDLAGLIRQERKFRKQETMEGQRTPPTMSEMLAVEKDLKTREQQPFQVRQNFWIDLPRNWLAYPPSLRIRMLETHRNTATADKQSKMMWQQAIDDTKREELISQQVRADAELGKATYQQAIKDVEQQKKLQTKKLDTIV